ncbi:MAG: MopE-related protein [Sandaracinaceae bacterium]|nr:MopE-related protein [Sandaracinaceae bacterium]
MLSSRSLVLVAIVASACGGPTTSSDAGRSDGGGDSGPAVVPCESNRACDDGVYCNGEEVCLPGDPLGDARGCVAGSPPCMPSQTCDEAVGRCVSDCAANPDADGDFYVSEDCGGDDCDDSDRDVNPRANEVCDELGRDEDCNPETLSGPTETDLDGDGHVDAACCNRQATGAILCGLDCDDSVAAARPGYPETCDEIDNDCDGMIDERVRTTYYRDADGDLYGDAADSTEACAQPEGYVASMGDCDDSSASVHPAAPESCNELDDDCDTSVDEDAPPGPESCGACGLVCPAAWTCVEGSCVDGAVEVGAGTNTICVRLATGRVFCWGASELMWSVTPIEVSGLAPASDLAVGGATVCAITGGVVRCLGRDFLGGPHRTSPEAVAVPGTARQVAVGQSHACVVTTDRSVYCWGANASGQLGDGTVTDRAAPVRAGTLRADEVSAGEAHTCARDGSTVYCWGENASRQLGNGTTADSSAPAPSSVPTSTERTGVGGNTSCAATASTVYCWGSNDRGQAGSNPGLPGGTAIEPTQVSLYPSLSTVELDSSAASYRTGGLGGGTLVRLAATCALPSNERVYCWGDALPAPTGAAYSARQIPGLANVTSMTVGAFVRSDFAGGGVFTCAVDRSGALWCWGYNEDNFLRTGDTGSVANPRLVTDIPPEMAPLPR